MNELLSQLMIPEMMAAFTFVVILLVVLYVLSIVWVARDSYLRGTTWFIWTAIALVPFIGAIAYIMLRPPLLQIDRDEQELEIALKQRELRKYGECGNCGYPVESDYVLCPNCHQRLKNLCAICNHALDPAWTVCPYCTTSVPGVSSARRPRRPRQKPQNESVQRAPVEKAELPDTVAKAMPKTGGTPRKKKPRPQPARDAEEQKA